MDHEPSSGGPHPVREIGYLHAFRCEPPQCLQLCCTRYGHIPVDEATVARWTREAPELLGHVETQPEAGHRIALRDGRCPALKGIGCDIHARYGTDLQPDACHFYPRRVSRVGNVLLATSSLSCDVLLRRALSDEDAFAWHEARWPRLPQDVPDLRATGPSARLGLEALQMHERMLRRVDEPGRPSGEAVAALLVTAALLDGWPRGEWSSRLDSAPPLDADFLRALCPPPPAATEPGALDAFLTFLGALSRAPHHGELARLARDARSLVRGENTSRTAPPREPRGRRLPLETVLKRYVKARLCERLFPLGTWGTCLDDAWMLAASYIVLRLGLLARAPGPDAPAPPVDLESAVRAATGVEFWLHGRRQEIHDEARRRGWLDLHRTLALLVHPPLSEPGGGPAG